MSMYLPNTDLQPTGSEAAEFIETARMDEGDGRAGPRDARREGPTMRLDDRTRLDLTHRAAEYISDAVRNHHGDLEDVRAIIHDLHDESAFIDHDGRGSTRQATT